MFTGGGASAFIKPLNAVSYRKSLRIASGRRVPLLYAATLLNTALQCSTLTSGLNRQPVSGQVLQFLCEPAQGQILTPTELQNAHLLFMMPGLLGEINNQISY